MSDEFLGDRRKALEEAFFAKQNQQLLEQMRAQVQTEEQKQSLAAASGIQSDAALEKLLAAGVDAQTVAALSLVPLVEVAWAEGRVSQDERAAVLKAAEASGVALGTPAHDLLESWLDMRPAPQMLSAWKEYVAALRDTVDPNAFASIRDTVLTRAQDVAAATGGFLGIGSVSAKEKAMLAELEQAFQG